MSESATFIEHGAPFAANLFGIFMVDYYSELWYAIVPYGKSAPNKNKKKGERSPCRRRGPKGRRPEAVRKPARPPTRGSRGTHRVPLACFLWLLSFHEKESNPPEAVPQNGMRAKPPLSNLLPHSGNKLLKLNGLRAKPTLGETRTFQNGHNLFWGQHRQSHQSTRSSMVTKTCVSTGGTSLSS